MSASDPIAQFLKDQGPSRSSLIAAALADAGLEPAAARQRLSRVRPPLRRFPIQLLPKGESFLYAQVDRNTDRFWTNFLRDLRVSNSVYGAAIDGMIARGGVLTRQDFDVISGATISPRRGQLSAESVANKLLAADFIRRVTDVAVDDSFALSPGLGLQGASSRKAARAVESVLLDGIREWARKLGLASYNSIAIRGEASLRPIGAFAFDLGGPSYLLPLQRSASQPGFLVADVFADGTLDGHHIQFFIRKARMLKAVMKSGILPILMADSFTSQALTVGHAAGVVLATPKDLFGRRAGAAITSLVQTLNNAAAYASSSPDRLTALIENLMDIEGRAGNLRGILFELIVGYLARRDAVSIDMGVKAINPDNGLAADIDVQKIASQASAVTAIECKGKIPGGVVDATEVAEWLAKTPIIRAHYRNHSQFREATVTFELWTSGTFDADALALLEAEKVRRTSAPISWRDGPAVLDLARQGREKSIADALQQHFFRHPLAVTA